MQRKRKLSLVEILIVVSILLILMTIIGPRARKAQQRSRPAAGAPAASQTDRSGSGDQYFMRP